MNLFSNQPNTDKADVIQANIHSDFVGNLMSKLGLSQETNAYPTIPNATPGAVSNRKLQNGTAIAVTR